MHLASVTGQGRGATDPLLAGVVTRLSRSGVRIVGALRPVAPDGEPGHCDNDLWLLPEGPLMRITQHLGTGSAACRMDAGAFEEAVGLVMSRLQAGDVDLVVLNKFGLREAEGHGFRTVIAEALGRAVPVLTGVSDTHKAALERFAEGMATHLEPREDAILVWCRSVVGRDATLTEEV